MKEIQNENEEIELLKELRQMYLVNANMNTGMPSASMQEILDLWNRVNELIKEQEK